MGDQDWKPVVFTKTFKQKTAGLSSAQSITAAKMAGIAVTEKKHGAAENKAAASGASLAKLENSTEAFAHASVNKDLSKAITQARLAKKMTQAQLAQAINERAQVIQQYECGSAIPNPQVLTKLDRALGIHLPRGKK